MIKQNLFCWHVALVHALIRPSSSWCNERYCWWSNTQM